MKKILLIGTGGTIASKEMGDGLSPGLAAEEIVNYVPEVKDLCEIDVFQLCNIDSTNMNPRIWTALAQAKPSLSLSPRFTSSTSSMAKACWFPLMTIPK